MQKFNYHTHTYRCGHADLNYMDEDYIKDMIKMGFKKNGFYWSLPSKGRDR